MVVTKIIGIICLTVIALAIIGSEIEKKRR